MDTHTTQHEDLLYTKQRLQQIVTSIFTPSFIASSSSRTSTSLSTGA